MKNPALKIILSFVFSLFVAYTKLNFLMLIPILLLVILNIKDLFKIIKKLVMLNFFIMFLVVFTATLNIDEAIRLFIITNLILFFNLLIFNKSNGFEIVRGLKLLKFPNKFVSIFYFAITIIDYLVKDIRNVKATLKLRGFRNSFNLYTYQTYGNIFAMMFIKSIVKANEISVSLTTRGFKEEIYLFESTEVSKIDIIISVVVICVYLYTLIGVI